MAQGKKFAGSMRSLRVLLGRELSQFAQSVTTDDPMVLKRAVEQMVPELTERYGDMAATVARDWYEQRQARWGLKRPARVTLAPAVDREALSVNIAWALDPVFVPGGVQPGNLDQVTGRLGQVSGKAVTQQAWDTVGRASRADRVRWARATDGRCCEWCSVLASRGAVYWSERKADAATHDSCGCEPVPVRSPDDLPDYYDPDALYEHYAKFHAPGDSITDVTRRMRNAKDS